MPRKSPSKYRSIYTEIDRIVEEQLSSNNSSNIFAKLEVIHTLTYRLLQKEQNEDDMAFLRAILRKIKTDDRELADILSVVAGE